MPEEIENSKNDNEADKNIVQPAKTSEDKNSSIERPEDSSTDIDDSKTDQAVDDIVKQGDDELLAMHAETKPGKQQKRWYHLFKTKKFVIPAAVVVVLLIIFGIPKTRYPLLGLFLKEKYAVMLTDSQTGNPVSDAQITLAGKTSSTSNQGQASVKTKVGYATITISKKYYKTVSEKILVPLHQKTTERFKLQATGRQVPLKIVNLISGSVVENAEISAAGTSVKTDGSGQATMVLPAGVSSENATINASGYNNLSVKITVTGKVVPTNTFKLTPSGRIYFLSNLSGNIDVVSANLDGSGRKTVLAGTGSEDPNNTVLLASRDWKYLALLSKRNGGSNAELFLINTSNGQLTTIDKGDASFSLTGWSGHYFIYEVSRQNVNQWQSGQTALKSYDADTGKLTTIDQTSAQGSQDNYISSTLSLVNLVGNQIVYGFSWGNGAGFMSVGGKQDSIYSVNPDGSDKQNLRNISLSDSMTYTYLSSVLYKPDTLYIRFNNYGQGGDNSSYFIYQESNNSVTESNTITDSSFNQAQQNYYTYLESPSGNQTFWSEPRDGKNTLFVGDYYADNGKQIASLSDYIPYGWYTDNYLLVEKSGSELYIVPASGKLAGSGSSGSALKISDYYKPQQTFYGYGGGYGGQ